MQESTITKIALVTFFVGIILLFAFLKTAKLDERSITTISDKDIDKTIALNGRIVAAQKAGNNYFLTIAQQCFINVSLFGAENLSLIEGQNITVTGKVVKTNDGYSIIAEEVK
ncbi:hypothetical protein HZA96_03055 [Candidatus Woesearchaeota archaeon]|nr:hypothetical protein [Candidatus Woesearchaeota archaeon]